MKIVENVSDHELSDPKITTALRDDIALEFIPPIIYRISNSLF